MEMDIALKRRIGNHVVDRNEQFRYLRPKVAHPNDTTYEIRQGL